MATTCPAIDGALVARDILVTLSGATLGLVQLELFNAVREFCEFSLAVRGDSEDVLGAGSTELVLADTAEGLEVIKLLYLRTATGRVYPYPAGRRVGPSGATGVLHYWVRNRNQLVFLSTPDADTPINAVVALSTPLQSTVIPAIVYREFYEAIKAGTLGRLYGQPAKPYTNLPLARQMMGRAKALMAQARYTADREGTMGDPEWRYPVFGV